LRIGLVVQRYGEEIIGGAELHARWIAQRLARRHEVEVLTTCAVDYLTWENKYEPGSATVGGLPVVRFPVTRGRTSEGFDALSSKVHFFDHSDEEERRWMEEHGPVTPGLPDHLQRRGGDYDALVFFSYRYWTTYHGLRVAPRKSILVPTAEEDGAVRLRIFKELFRLPAAHAFNSPEEKELLLRMTGEDGELLPASSFIEAAERSGMVQELDRWVVARALELIGEHERAGAPVSLHMNISGASVTDLSVLEFIERRLDEEGADPSRCTFELTETANIYENEVAAGFADRLTDVGCQVAIDDYGAGFGPFHHLKRIPFDLIKIDGSFVRDMPNSDADQLTVQAIVQIARGLGKATIAEYVQDDKTTEMLREYGVDMAQGFHLGRPMDLDQALAA
jgi:EAL domain-containing protein (putative c-di-GMP-specific phosphodiesterase class I)